MINNKKSGQVTLILVMVTMIAALGIAVASSSQSKLNLKDTVYSTQSSQALSCAEGGIERALNIVNKFENEPIPDNAADVASLLPGITVDYDSAGPTIKLSSDQTDFQLEGCDSYNVDLTDYPEPGSGGLLEIPGIRENSIQQLNLESNVPGHYVRGDNLRILFDPANVDESAIVLAIYQYSSDGYADRRVVSCKASGLLDNSDYEVATTNADGLCQYDLTLVGNPQTLRLRPMFADAYVKIEDFRGTAGYLIKSSGDAGEVDRSLQVYTFYSQLPAGMDEAIVSYDEDDILD